jgi:hypothetical protein
LSVVTIGSKKVAGADTATLAAESIAGIGVLSPTSKPAPATPKNAMLGVVTVNCVNGSAKDTIWAESVVGISVLRYSPPQVFNAESLVGLSVLRDATATAQVSSPKNAMLGSVGVSAVLSSTEESVACESMVGFLVVREFHPRKEHITMTIEYGADAEFNTGGN